MLSLSLNCLKGWMHMKHFMKKKALLLVLLLLVATGLSGCYTEPEVIQGGTDSVYNGSVPYPVYSQSVEPTATPTPTGSTGQLVIFPDAQTDEPTTTSTASGGIIVIGVDTTGTIVPTVTPTPTPTASTVLKKGSTGTAVRELQQKLKNLGYLTGSVDGSFGEATEKAVKAFQKAVGLYADGVAGTKTLEKLATSKVTAKPTVTPTPKPTATPVVSKNTYLKVGSSGAQVTKMQERLIALGYLDGKATGKFDSITEAAVIAFQKRNTSYSDGIAGYLTLTALYKSSAKKASTSSGIIGISLKEGSTNTSAVKTLQRKLKALKYLSGTIDGTFGSATTSAVKAFQKNNGLNADGVAGGTTLTKLFTGSPKSASESGGSDDDDDSSTVTNPPSYRTVTEPPSGSDYITLRLGDSGTPVKTLQTYLKKKGYFSGTVDGRYGTATYEAVKKFQKAKGLKQDGIAGAATQRVLIEGDFPIGS